ncbi:MAG: ABC transporter substrate-binding protein [Oceanospirillales bacterium]|nr:ABC transporter substrate-binding protein [Oceanospirillales bacterium]
MNNKNIKSIRIGLLLVALTGLFSAFNTSASEGPLCGSGSGIVAQGEPILVGAITGATGPDDFSSATKAARAYFDCVNNSGGIHGRPIEYLIEDDQWNPEVAAQAASKLVKDVGVVAMVASSSFVEMTVNAKLYEKENITEIAAACAVRECFEAKNIASLDSGPLPSNLAATQWAVQNLGSKSVACIGLNIPSNGIWSCGAVVKWMEKNQLAGVTIPMNPGAPDMTNIVIDALSSGADTVLLSLPANAAIGILKTAQELGFADKFKWISPTPLYHDKVPEALGPYWSDKVYVNMAITSLDGNGPDATRLRKVMDEYADVGVPRDAFAHLGFLSANIFVDTLLEMAPDSINRDAVTSAIRNIKQYKSDLVCGDFYFGPGNRHMPIHAGRMAVLHEDGWKILTGCFNAESEYLDDIYALEKTHNLISQ